MDPCLCASLRQAARIITQAYDAALRPSGLRSTQFSILMNIAGRGPIRLSDLVGILQIDQTTLTRSLSLLESEGLLERVKAEDARERRFQVTAKARRTLQIAVPLWTSVQNRFRNQMGPSAWRKTHGVLQVLQNLEAGRP